MHLHLPKPLHGWRELLGEVGIIVVGVLIALGAEQVVETLHWRSEVATERHSLLAEAHDAVEGVAFRASQQQCIDRRLAEIHTILERNSRGEPLGIIGKVGSPARISSSHDTWQIALAGQALSHMPHDEKLKFSDAFAQFQGWDTASSKELDMWRELGPLNDPDLLAEQDWSALRLAYARVVDMNQRVGAYAPWLVRTVSNELGLRDISIAGVPGFEALTQQICKPLLQPQSPKTASAKL